MTIDLGSGAGGASAQREYERRLKRRDAAIEDKWGSGRLGRFVKAVGPIPQSTEAWGKGADGERRLAATLERRAAEDVVFLHDRSVPGRKGNIDHLAVASTGVWVIDAKNYSGKVERRDLGTWRTVDDRLYVGGRDRTKLVRGMAWQSDVVRSVVDSLGIDVDVRCVLCFTDAEWGLFAKPFKIDGVIVTYPSALASAVSAGGLLMTEHVRTIATELRHRLPAALASSSKNSNRTANPGLVVPDLCPTTTRSSATSNHDSQLIDFAPLTHHEPPPHDESVRP